MRICAGSSVTSASAPARAKPRATDGQVSLVVINNGYRGNVCHVFSFILDKTNRVRFIKAS